MYTIYSYVYILIHTIQFRIGANRKHSFAVRKLEVTSKFYLRFTSGLVSVYVLVSVFVTESQERHIIILP